MLGENINSKDDTKKYQVTRKSKTGRMTATSIAVGLAAVITVAGIGKIIVTELGNTLNREKYSYDSNYDSYSNQIEDMLHIDLDNSLEDSLNSMQTMRETISAYKEAEGLISKSDLLKCLMDNKNDFENAALNIAKEWCANQWGGAPKEYEIVPNDYLSSDWSAVNKKEGKSYLLSGDIRELAKFIGNLHTYSREKVEISDNPREFVDTCNRVAQASGVVAVDITESKSSDKGTK